MLRNLVFSVLAFPENPLKDKLRSYFYGNVISERIVEYTLVVANLKYEPSLRTKILDIGSYYSNLPLQLASMGYAVTAIDLADYQLTHPYFKFIKGDITNHPFKKNSFDIVTCVSTLEHIGVGYYTGDKKNLANDMTTVNVIHSILKKEGRFLLTVPFGVKTVNSLQRVYDWESLKELLSDFKIEKAYFYKDQKEKWLKVSKEQAAKVKSTTRTKAMAFVVAVKEK